MKSCKKLLCLLLVLCACVGILTVSALADDSSDLTAYSTPTSLVWNADGTMSWIIEGDVPEHFLIYMYSTDGERVGQNSVYVTSSMKESVANVNMSTGEISYSTRITPEVNYVQLDLKNFTTGSYYYTVYARADSTHTASEKATSSTWNYTKPDVSLETPSVGSWDWPTVNWTRLSDESNVAWYQFRFYFSETLTGEKKSFLIHSIPTSMLPYEFTFYSDYYTARFGSGYYWFTVRVTSNDINAYYCSEESDFCKYPVYYDSETGEATTIISTDPSGGNESGGDGGDSGDSSADEESLSHVVSFSPESGSTIAYTDIYDEGALKVTITFNEAVEVITDSDGDFAADIVLVDAETGEEFDANFAGYPKDDSSGCAIEIWFGYNLGNSYYLKESLIPSDSQFYIKIDEGVIHLTDSDEYFTISEESTWTLSTDNSILNIFNIGILPFSNSRAYFECKNYDVSQIMEARLVQQFGNDKGLQNTLYKKLYEEKWGGSCFGMSAVVTLTYAGGLDLGSWDAASSDAETIPITSCQDVATPKDSKQAFGAMDLINYYQLCQEKIGWTKAEKRDFMGAYWVVCWAKECNEIIDDAKNLSTTNEPFMIGFIMSNIETDEGTENANHSCVVIGYKYDDSTESHTLYLYDPSYPGTKTTMVFTPNFYSYNVKLYGGWGTKTDDSEEYIVDIIGLRHDLISDLASYNIDATAAEYTGNTATASASLFSDDEEDSSDTTNYATLICTAARPFTITNAEGQTLTYSDGEFSGDLTLYNAYDVSFGQTPEFELEVDPSASFTYTSDDDSFSFTVYQDDFYLSSSVSLSEADSDETSSICITTGDSVEISASGEYEYYVRVTPDTVDSGMTSLTGTATGDLTADYVDGANMTVDGDGVESLSVVEYRGTERTETEVDLEADSEEAVTVDPGFAEEHLGSWETGDEGETTVTMENTGMRLTDALVYAATYDENGKMTSISVGEVGTDGYSLLFSDELSAGTKLFFVDAETKAPLCESVTLDADTQQ